MNSLLDVINKQRRVHGLMQQQNMVRHDVAALLLQKQHDVELGSLIAQSSPEELALCLQALDVPDAQRIWKLIPSDMANRVLWSLSEADRKSVV